MPDLDEYRISELDPVLDLGQDDLMEVSVEDDNAESGHSSRKAPLSQLGAFFVNILQYVTSLKTSSKTVTGAINQTVSNFANDYDSTSTYAVDDCVIYGGVLYKCTTAITVAEAWDSTHWTQIKAVDVGGGGGTTDYSDLTNKPQINSVELSGNKSLDDLGIQSKNLTATASGSIATFSNGGDDIPVSEFECEIVAQQASGTPTPDNPLPITGFSQSDVLVSGKNLLDIAHVTSNSNAQYKAFGSLISTNIPDGSLFLPQGTYTFSVSNIMELLNVRDDNGDLITSATTTNSLTFTLSKTTKLKITLSKTNGDWSNYTYQLEKSNQATTYEAYTGNLYTVSFGQTIYGGRLIYKNGQWSIEATHIMLNFSDFDFSASNPSSHVFRGDYSGTYKDNIKFPPNPHTATTAITEHYEAMAWQPLSASDNGKFAINDYGTVARFVFIDYNYSTQADFETARASDKIVVPIITPVIIPITSATRVKTISGDNNIYSNTGNCELKYFTNKADSLAELVKAEIASTSADYHEYSTEEKIVGKWIDGRTVYEKTMNVGAIGSGTTFAHGITNLDWIIDYSIFGLYAGQNKLVSPANGSSSSIGFVISGWDSTNITFTKGNLSSNFTDCYCTIRYIKSTSNTRSLNLSKGIEEKPIEEKTEEIKTEEINEEEKF